MARQVLEQCKSLLQYIQTFCKEKIQEFSAEQFVAIFGAYMKMRNGYRVASIQFSQFLEQYLLSHLEEFDHVQILILLSVLQHRKQEICGHDVLEKNNKLIQKLIEAKDKLTQSQMSSLVRKKAQSKIRQEIKKTVNRIKNSQAHYSQYEVPKDQNLQKWSSVQKVESKVAENRKQEVDEYKFKQDDSIRKYKRK